MTYTPPKCLTFEEFLTSHGDNPRYELIDGNYVTGHTQILVKKFLAVLQVESMSIFLLNEKYRLRDAIASNLLPNLQLKLEDIVPQ